MKRVQEEESGDEDDDYERRYKTSCTGLGAMLGHVAEMSKTGDVSQVKKTNQDSIPIKFVCDVGPGAPKSLKKQRVSYSFFCDVCQIELNSQVTYDSHIMGAKHLKKEKNLKAKKSGKNNKNVGSSDFRERIYGTEEPIVGLSYIEEILPLTDPKGVYDSMYRCGLCCTTGSSVSMFDHIVGSKHRTKLLEMKHNIRDLAKEDVRTKCAEVEKKEGKNLDVVTVVVSDTLYPWPVGHSPRSAEGDKERGGGEGGPSLTGPSFGGPLPDYGSCGRSRPPAPGYDYSRHIPPHNNPYYRQSLAESPVSSILQSVSGCAVKNEDDATMAVRVSAALVRQLAEYKRATGDERTAGDVAERSDSVLNIINQIFNTPMARSVAVGNQSDENVMGYRREGTTGHFDGAGSGVFGSGGGREYWREEVGGSGAGVVGYTKNGGDISDGGYRREVVGGGGVVMGFRRMRKKELYKGTGDGVINGGTVGGRDWRIEGGFEAANPGPWVRR